MREHRWALGFIAVFGLLAVGPPAGAAPPAAATLVGPAGAISGSSLTFTWQAAGGATFYYVQVNDATASPRFALWYPAAQACPGDSATCSATVTTGFASGAGIWWVRTWNADGFGPWSLGLAFSVVFAPGAWSDPPGSDRFQLVFGGLAVLDKATGLVWERTPSTATVPTWADAIVGCPIFVSIGNTGGWRLPRAGQPERLDPRESGTARRSPLQHREHGVLVDHGRPVDFQVGGVSLTSKVAGGVRRWCVRGGATAQSPQ
jgi:hypothetical protein